MLFLTWWSVLQEGSELLIAILKIIIIGQIFEIYIIRVLHNFYADANTEQTCVLYMLFWVQIFSNN